MLRGDMATTTARQAQILEAAKKHGGVSAAAKALGVSAGRVRQVVAMAKARADTSARALQRQQPAAMLIVEPPTGTETPWAAGWTPDEAREAVDSHMRGSFVGSWQLWTDIQARFDLARAAVAQRLASPLGLPWTVEGPRRAPGRYERDAARVQWVAFFADMLEATLRDVIGLGLSVWKHTIAVNAATGRHEITELCRWPIAAVGWTSTPTGLLDYDERGELVASLDRSPCYYAITKGGKRIRLPKPGTSTERWTVVGKGPAPHLYGAVCAVATRYTSDGVSQKSRDNLGTAMGRAVPAYFMPDGVQMVDDAGNPTPEAEAAATVVAGMGTGRSGAVFAGGKLDKYEVGSTTTGFFHEKLLDDLLRVSLAIMGRGGALAKTDAQYQGAAEMDVPESLIRADVELIQRAGSRLLSLVAAMNQEGVAIEVCGNMPDTDQDVRRKDRADRELKRTEILQARRDAGILVTQEDADCLAFDLDLDPLPLAVSAQKAEIFAYDLDGGILTRGTAATIKGLPLPPQPDMTVPEYKAWLDRQAQQPPVAPAQMAPAAAMPPPVADPPMPLLEEEAPQPEDAAARLAEKMTAHGLDRCEHGRPNRCPLCGVERVRDFEPGPDGAPMWKVAWQAIDQPPAGPPAAA